MYVVFDVACCPVFVCMLCVFLHAAILLVMAALHSRCGHYIFVLFLSCSFFFFPRLISVVADWMSTILLHMVWP